VTQPIPPPPEHEMPRLSPAATNNPNIVAPPASPSRVIAPPPAPQPKPPPNRPATSRADFLAPPSGALATAASSQPPPPAQPRRFRGPPVGCPWYRRLITAGPAAPEAQTTGPGADADACRRESQ